jgi:hypothetical protein
MAIEPSQRYRSVHELRTALLTEPPLTNPPIPATQLIVDPANHAGPVVSDPVQTPASLPISKPKIRQLRLALTILASLLVLGVIGLLLVG